MRINIKNIVSTPVFTVLGGNAAASVLGLLIFALLGRYLSNAEFGIWVLFTTAISMADLIRSGLVKTSLIWSLASKEKEEWRPTVGAAWCLMLLVSLALALSVATIQYLIPEWVDKLNLTLFFKFYPFYAILSAPFYVVSWILQAERRFAVSQIGRLLVNVSILLAFGIQYLYGFRVINFVGTFILSHGAISFIYLTFFDSGFSSAFQTKIGEVRKLWNYGRNSLATLAGGSLLRGTDVYFIGAWLGPEAVAVYSIPMKIIDFLDIPLRSIAIAEFSRLVGLWENRDRKKFGTKMYALIAAGLGISLVTVVPLLFLSDYITAFFNIDNGEGRLLIMIFAVAMLLLPIEKFLGVGFDAIGRPDLNARKVWAMLTFNVLGDLLALHYFHSIYLVAVVTIGVQLVGILYSSRFFDLNVGHFMEALSGFYTLVRKKLLITTRPEI